VAGAHGIGGELADGDEGVGEMLVSEDGLQGGDGLLELLLYEVLQWTLRRGLMELLKEYVMDDEMSKVRAGGLLAWRRSTAGRVIGLM
jgi:hypothetical protein